MINALDVMPPTAWWYAFLPLTIIGVVIIGVIALIAIGILIGRRVAITVKTGGAIALTLASIVLLSGVWCMFISPTATYTETKDSFYQSVTIDALGSWSRSFTVQEGELIDGSVNEISAMDRSSNATGKTFNFHIYDPEKNAVWSEMSIKDTYFSVQATRSGVYRVEIQNPNQKAIECRIQISTRVKATYRPLEPLGQWLSLISIPIFGLGIWTSGILEAIKRKTEKRDQSFSPSSTELLTR